MWVCIFSQCLQSSQLGYFAMDKKGQPQKSLSIVPAQILRCYCGHFWQFFLVDLLVTKIKLKLYSYHLSRLRSLISTQTCVFAFNPDIKIDINNNKKNIFPPINPLSLPLLILKLFFFSYRHIYLSVSQWTAQFYPTENVLQKYQQSQNTSDFIKQKRRNLKHKDYVELFLHFFIFLKMLTNKKTITVCGSDSNVPDSFIRSQYFLRKGFFHNNFSLSYKEVICFHLLQSYFFRIFFLFPLLHSLSCSKL